MTENRRGRRFPGVRSAILGCLVALLFPLTSVSAADVSPITDMAWDVGDADPGVAFTGGIRALVWDIEEHDGTVYVAGKFLNVYADNGDQFPQPYLAAFDLETGEWVHSFQPNPRGPIYAIDITDDGTIIAGGEIPGGLQAIDANSGADVQGFATNITYPSARPAVFDVEIVGDVVYLGGRFTKSGTTTLGNLARVDLNTGALDQSWRPTTQLDTGTPRDGGINVFGLSVDQTRDRVYIAGKFGGVNGNSTAAYFATLNTSSGALRTDVPQGLPPGILSHRELFSMWQHDVQFHADRVYVGGQAHQTLILDATTLKPLRSFFTDRGFGQEFGGGDTQVLHVGKTTVWAGCHCWGVVAEYPLGYRNSANRSGNQGAAEYRSVMSELNGVQGSFGQRPVSAGYGIDLATGNRVDIDFQLNGQAGAHAMLEDSNGRLWVGGQFTQDTHRKRAVRGLARFSRIEANDANPPAPTGLRSTYQNRDRLVLTWLRRAGAARYEVLQDGVVIGTNVDPWRTVFNLRAGTTYNYSVRAVLTDGTVTAVSAPVAVSTRP
ncbi:MAG: two-component regulator propeller domain-containing protein [Acidimicrobiales bacterium]